MRTYWPLLLIVGLLATVIGMSQYADSAKQRHEDRTKHANGASVAKGDDSKTGQNTEDAYQPPVWAKFVTWPEGVGAWAVILTLLAIVWQSAETRRAANAARDSIRLQELAMEQWVDVNNWDSGCKLNDQRELTIRFDITNPTNFPVTLPDANFTFVLGTDKAEFHFRPNCRLTPKNPETGWVSFRLTEPHAEQYHHGRGIPFRVWVDVSHTGVLKKYIAERFPGNLMCHREWDHFERHSPEPRPISHMWNHGGATGKRRKDADNTEQPHA